MSFLLFHPILLIAVSLDTYMLKRLAPFVESYSLHDFCLAMALFFLLSFFTCKKKERYVWAYPSFLIIYEQH